ncbi:MAG: sigma-70 family RNA polymerase sigma factor [Lachnospiraceae bacterium]|nr:sigma-70 family RNA polymerase sigma factor [Lachnospiraceae bacterium]
MSSKPSAKEEEWRKKLERAQQGDRQSRDQLVTENMGLVHMAAKRFRGRGVEAEELVQIGAIGLIKAIDNFDCRQPYQFSTYAVPMIIGEIRRFLRNDGMVHISRQIKENAGKIATVREKMKKSDNKEPTLEELERETGLSQEDLVMAMDASLPVVSIFQPAAGDDSSLTLMDQLEDEKDFEVPVLNRIAVDQAMEELKEEERQLLSLRYLDNLTQARTADALGMNQVAVSRMERKILKKLRNLMA